MKRISLHHSADENNNVQLFNELDPLDSLQCLEILHHNALTSAHSLLTSQCPRLDYTLQSPLLRQLYTQVQD